jgi:hypothetical protein
MFKFRLSRSKPYYIVFLHICQNFFNYNFAQDTNPLKPTWNFAILYGICWCNSRFCDVWDINQLPTTSVTRVRVFTEIQKHRRIQFFFFAKSYSKIHMLLSFFSNYIGV